VILVMVIVGYALFIRPKEEDAPKRMSTFQWLMKKRREKMEAEAAAGADSMVAGSTATGSTNAGGVDDGETAHLTMARQHRRTGEKKVRK
jgi:hypothetical protein